MIEYIFFLNLYFINKYLFNIRYFTICNIFRNILCTFDCDIRILRKAVKGVIKEF